MTEIVVSPTAAERLRQVVGETLAAERSVRLYLDHRCHCGGLKYGMELATPGADDQQVQRAGVTFYVDPAVADEPGTATIDYAESPLQSGFTLVNSEHQCGGMTH